MANAKLYSRADIQVLLEDKSLWVSITEPVLKKKTNLWDGVSNTIVTVVDYQTRHPEFKAAYVLRDLHTGESVVMPQADVHKTYRKYVPSTEVSQIRKGAPPSTGYHIRVNISGELTIPPDSDFTDLSKAKSRADSLAISGFEVVVIDKSSGSRMYTGVPPDLSEPRETVPGAVLDTLRKRESRPLTADLLEPGLVVRQQKGKGVYIYRGVDPNDRTRHVFVDLETGKAESSIPATIARGIYYAIVPRADDFLTILPTYPREAYSLLVRRHGDVYADAPPDEPLEIPKVIKATETRRAVGEKAAERRKVAAKKSDKYFVEYATRGKKEPEIFETRYKSEYQATRRAEGLLAQPGVVWSSVVEIATGERIVVFPPGFDPDAGTEPPEQPVYRVRYFRDDPPPGDWADHAYAYKTLASAEKKARDTVATDRRVQRAVVFETPGDVMVFLAEREGDATRLRGKIDPKKVPDFDRISGPPTPTPPPPPTSRPLPTIRPRPPGKPTIEETKEAFEKVAERTRPEAWAAAAARTMVQEELSLTVATKLINLACVATISKYNVSIVESTTMCNENSEMLDRLSRRLSQSEITIYDAIDEIDSVLTEAYSLEDLRTTPVAPTPVGVDGEIRGDLVTAIEHAVKVAIEKLPASRRGFIAKKTGTVTKEELTEAAYELAFGERKRSTARGDIIIDFIDIGAATPEALWEDFGIIAEEYPGGLMASFDVTLTTDGYMLHQYEGKSRPGKGFLGVLGKIRKKYSAVAVLNENKDRVNIELLM